MIHSIQDHPILAALTALAALVAVLVLACCRAASKPLPKVDWNKEDYKQ